MTISKELFLAILSMDAYNHGYSQGIAGLGGLGTSIGNAKITTDSETTHSTKSTAKAAGFYAILYTLDKAVGDLATNTTIISYRGTDRYFA